MFINGKYYIIFNLTLSFFCWHANYILYYKLSFARLILRTVSIIDGFRGTGTAFRFNLHPSNSQCSVKAISGTKSIIGSDFNGEHFTLPPFQPPWIFIRGHKSVRRPQIVGAVASFSRETHYSKRDAIKHHKLPRKRQRAELTPLRQFWPAS